MSLPGLTHSYAPSQADKHKELVDWLTMPQLTMSRLYDCSGFMALGHFLH